MAEYLGMVQRYCQECGCSEHSLELTAKGVYRATCVHCGKRWYPTEKALARLEWVDPSTVRDPDEDANELDLVELFERPSVMMQSREDEALGPMDSMMFDDI